jgi:hypothetical protein
MADPYSIMMNLGTRGDEYDDDLTRRRLDEQEKIRLEDRNEQREIAREFRKQAQDISAEGRKLEDQKKIGQYNELLAAKMTAAERGINFKGKDLFQLKADIAAYDRSIPLSDYFAIEKQYIDLLPDDNDGPISRLKAMTPEEFGQLDRSEALSLQAMVKPLIDSVKIQNQARIVRSSNGYKEFKDKYDRNSQQIAKIIQDVMAPALIKMSANSPGAIAAHAATMAVLNNDPRYKELFPDPAARKTFGMNPTAFIDQQAGEGYANINDTDSAKLMVLYDEARTLAVGMLNTKTDLVINNADGTAKSASAEEKQDAIKFLREEAQMKDNQNRRDNMTRLLPDLIKVQDNLLATAPDAWKRYLAVDTTTALEELDTSPAAAAAIPQDTKPSLPGQRPSALGTDPSRSAYETMVGGQAPAPAPVVERPTAPVPTPNTVTVEGGLPAQARLDAAKQILGEGYGEGFWSQRPWFRGALTPEKMVNEAAAKANKRKRIIESRLQAIMATRDPNNPNNVKVGQTTEGEVAQFRRFSDPDNQPFRFQLGDTPERAAPTVRDLTMKEIERRGAEALKLYGELDTINSQLGKLQNQAERQTQIKIPGLGSGARQ